MSSFTQPITPILRLTAHNPQPTTHTPQLTTHNSRLTNVCSAYISQFIFTFVDFNLFFKKVKELDIRAKYGVDILLIRNNTEAGSKIKSMANPDYVFSYNDSIVVSGEVGKIELLKNL